MAPSAAAKGGKEGNTLYYEIEGAIVGVLMRIKLPGSLRDWHTKNFASTFNREILDLPSGTLPLQSRGMQNGLVDDTNLSLVVLQQAETEKECSVKAGVFFSEIIGGCSCGDEPAAENAYCEVWIEISKTTAEARIRVAVG